jgi:hypothetical protein
MRWRNIHGASAPEQQTEVKVKNVVQPAQINPRIRSHGVHGTTGRIGVAVVASGAAVSRPPADVARWLTGCDSLENPGPHRCVVAFPRERLL